MSDYGVDPALMQQLMAFLQANPEYTAKGVQKPVSLTEQAKRTNYQQDQMQSMANPLFAAMLGGGQGFDLSAFNPVQDGVDTYNVPNNPMDNYVNLPDSSEEKKIAVGIQQGLSPEQIVASFRDNQGYVNNKDDKQLDRVRATANGMFKEQSQYRQEIQSVPGFDPSTGQWSAPEGSQHIAGKLSIPKFKPSDAAAIFEKAGLPTPNQQFGPSDFGFDGHQQQGLADQAAQIAALSDQASGAKQSWQDQGGSRSAMHPMLQKALAPLIAPNNSGRPQGENPNTAPSPFAAPNATPDEWAYAQSQGVPTPTSHAPATPQAAGRHAGSGHQTNPSAAQQAAYDKYTKLVTAQRGLERKLATDAKSSKFDEAYANKRSELTAGHGLTPLTLAMLQRSQALQGL